MVVNTEEIEQRKANIELKRQELEYEAKKKRQEIELDSEKRRKELEFELEKKRQQAKLEAEIKRAEEERIEKKRIETEQKEARKAEIEKKAAEEKAAAKKAEQQARAPYRRAIISIVLGVISIFTIGCFIVPEIVGVIFALKARTDGKLVKNAKIGLALNLISVVLLVVIIIWGLSLSK